MRLESELYIVDLKVVSEWDHDEQELDCHERVSDLCNGVKCFPWVLNDVWLMRSKWFIFYTGIRLDHGSEEDPLERKEEELKSHHITIAKWLVSSNHMLMNSVKNH